MDLVLLIGGFPIQMCTSVKYLCPTISYKLTCWKQIEKAADKAAEVPTAVSRLMPNVRLPRLNKPRLVLRITEAIRFYSSEA